MLKLLVAITAYGGHAAEIVDRITSALCDNNCAIEVCDLARSAPEVCTAESICYPGKS